MTSLGQSQTFEIAGVAGLTTSMWLRLCATPVGPADLHSPVLKPRLPRLLSVLRLGSRQMQRDWRLNEVFRFPS